MRWRRAAGADAVVCVTETGALFDSIRELDADLRLVAATPSNQTYRKLSKRCMEVVCLPMHLVNRFKQTQQAIAVVLQAGKIHPGELVVCVIGPGLSTGGDHFILLVDVEPTLVPVVTNELLALADRRHPGVVEAAYAVACKIGGAARRGKRLGAILMLGDVSAVLDGARQLVPNPFLNLDGDQRNILNPATHPVLVELAKLDGAFVLNDDGLIETAGAFLSSNSAAVGVPQGLGARHHTAAAVTARTKATAIVVSATDGNVRVFARGEIILRIDPDIALPPSTGK
ncbi:MAG: hypothetical protein HC814_03720 [Rhodobacteraceae bacterium]|nr:hypothetical protein [Paracoccaceae bacterium]